MQWRTPLAQAESIPSLSTGGANKLRTRSEKETACSKTAHDFCCVVERVRVGVSHATAII